MLRKVRLDGEPTASRPEDAEGDSQCAELRLGPTLFDLPLGEGAEPIFSATVPVGTYSGVEFQIHRPTNANEDADFVADHPELEDISIRVSGKPKTAAPFTFASDLTEVEDVVFVEPVEVAVDGEVQVTLHVDVTGWFASEDGTGLVNPEGKRRWAVRVTGGAPDPGELPGLSRWRPGRMVADERGLGVHELRAPLVIDLPNR